MFLRLVVVPALAPGSCDGAGRRAGPGWLLWPAGVAEGPPPLSCVLGCVRVCACVCVCGVVFECVCVCVCFSSRAFAKMNSF